MVLNPIITVNDMREELFKEWAEKTARKGLSTGWSSLDEVFRLNPSYLHVVTGIPGHGKALAIDTPIITPDGWKIMEDLQAGDRVFDESGQICNVVAVTPVMYDRPCYAMEFSDGSRIVCDEQHQWLTRCDKARVSERNAKVKGRNIDKPLKLRGTDQRHKRTYPQVRTTLEIANTLVTHHDGRPNHGIQNALALQMPERDDLPIHPYVLGAWLGDGRTDYAAITDAEGWVVNRISKLGYTIRKQNGTHQYGIIQGFVSKLREAGVLGNKHIPQKYLFASFEQRLHLLQGLLDTDGYAKNDGGVEFTTIKLNLAEEVVQLVRSLGLKTSITYGEAKLNGKYISPKYRIAFTSNGLNLFSMPRKQAKVNNAMNHRSHRMISRCERIASVPVKCIQVDSPNRLYLAGETMIPTHNSEVMDGLAVNTAILHDWKWLYYSPENFPTHKHLMKLIEKYIGKHKSKMAKDELLSGWLWAADHFTWLYPKEGETDLDSLLALVDVAGEFNAIVFDPWGEIDSTPYAHLSETEYIKQSLSKIRRFARQRNLAFFIVAHPTKLMKDKDGQYPVPDGYSISGSAHWRNLSDMLITIHRDNHMIDQASVYIGKVKQKDFGKAPAKVTLDYDWQSGRLKDLSATEYKLPEHDLGGAPW